MTLEEIIADSERQKNAKKKWEIGLSNGRCMPLKWTKSALTGVDWSRATHKLNILSIFVKMLRINKWKYIFHYHILGTQRKRIHFQYWAHHHCIINANWTTLQCGKCSMNSNNNKKIEMHLIDLANQNWISRPRTCNTSKYRCFCIVLHQSSNCVMRSHAQTQQSEKHFGRNVTKHRTRDEVKSIMMVYEIGKFEYWLRPTSSIVSSHNGFFLLFSAVKARNSARGLESLSSGSFQWGADFLRWCLVPCESFEGASYLRRRSNDGVFATPPSTPQTSDNWCSHKYPMYIIYIFIRCDAVPRWGCRNCKGVVLSATRCRFAAVQGRWNVHRTRTGAYILKTAMMQTGQDQRCRWTDEWY